MFIERVLTPVIARFPNLRVVIEHLTTKYAVEFIKSASTRIAGTITAHHLLLNRTAMFAGGLRPHLRRSLRRGGVLDRLEAFGSFHGADFYGLPRNNQRITLENTPWRVAESLRLGSETVIPFRGGETVNWRLAEVDHASHRSR